MRSHMKRKFELLPLVFFFAVITLCWGNTGRADTGIEVSRGQVVYVPVYSHIYSGDREHPFYLAVTVSIRNTDPENAMTVSKADYYDSNGALLKHYVENPIRLKPLETIRYVIRERDKAGGSGANFIIEWEADRKINSPIIESVMIGTQIQQGISFTSRGRVIKEK